MKTCPVCLKPKALDEFSKNRSRKDGLHNKCKSCASAYFSSWYSKNPDRKKAVLASLREKRLKRQALVIQFLKRNPCADCGEGDIIVLEFDHRDPSDKKGDISRLISSAKSDQEIISEMNKCDVRCANCHRRKTAKQFSTYRFLEAAVGVSREPS